MSEQPAGASRPIGLHSSWLEVLGAEFEQPYMQRLRAFLAAEKRAGKVIYPPSAQWFAAFNSTPFDRVKVVILGQDPYHGPGQAQGLCFSVPPGTVVPPSLVNIYKELQADLDIAPAGHGCLTHWAEQGVLLLDARLTVERGRAGAHQGKGWEAFTDRAIHVLNERRTNLVFILWGSYAQRKASFVDGARHLMLTAPHPSPLSAHRGFFGSRPFSRTNAWLAGHGLAPVDWQLPSA
jgi:uracil-DNA glycosylase